MFKLKYFLIILFEISLTQSKLIQVTSNNVYCTKIASNLLQRGATVVQAYIATSLCEGLVHPMDSGPGGGTQLLYSRGNGNVTFMTCREKSPFDQNFLKHSRTSGNSIGVPGVLACYAKLLRVQECHYNETCIMKSDTSKRNSLNYRDIFQPVIDLARSGFRISKTLNDIWSLIPLPKFIEKIDDSQHPELGKKIRNLAYAQFIEWLQASPRNLMSLYLTDNNKTHMYGDLRFKHFRGDLIKLARHYGSYLTAKDFTNFRANVYPAIHRKVILKHNGHTYNLTAYSMQNPAGGYSIQLALAIISSLQQRYGSTTLNPNVKSTHSLRYRCLLELLYVVYSAKIYSGAMTRQFFETKFANKKNVERMADEIYNDAQFLNLDSKWHSGNAKTTFGNIKFPSIKYRASIITDVNGDGKKKNDLNGNSRKKRKVENFQLKNNENTLSNTTTLKYVRLIDQDYNSLLNLIPDEQVENLKSLKNDDYYNEYYGDVDVDGADFNPFGTTNVALRFGNEMLVATSTINHGLGSKIFTNLGGFFLNNQMRDFNVDNIEYSRKSKMKFPNRARVHARPQSSMSCTILQNKNIPVFGIGGAGGSKITGATINVLWNYFINDQNLRQALNAPRTIISLHLFQRQSIEIMFEYIDDVTDSTRILQNFCKFTTQKRNQNYCVYSDFQQSYTSSNATSVIDATTTAILNARDGNCYLSIINEAGYSAITALASLGGNSQHNEAAHDMRRGGATFIKT